MTQLFFDNEKFYIFREKQKKRASTSPSLPHHAHHQSKPDRAHSSAERRQRTAKLQRLFDRYGHDRKAMFDAGIHYAIEQIMDLIANDVRGIHLYTMNNVEIATRVSDSIQNILESENNPS